MDSFKRVKREKVHIRKFYCHRRIFSETVMPFVALDRGMSLLKNLIQKTLVEGVSRVRHNQSSLLAAPLRPSQLISSVESKQARSRRVLDSRCAPFILKAPDLLGTRIMARDFTSGPGNHDLPRDSSDTSANKFGNGEFGSYQLVFPGKVSPLRSVPEHIRKPEYYETGLPNKISQIPILNGAEILKLRDACKLARLVLNSLVQKAEVGVTTDELDAHAHNLCLKHGAYPSPLNYHGFPKSICTSINNVACHGIPDDRHLMDGDIVNIDVTVYFNGFHGDCSETVSVGNVDKQGKRLMHATKECLYRGISVCGPNVQFREIGKAIQKYAAELGYVVVPAFTGHGIGAHFHTPPDIYHFDFDYVGKMQPGMAFTIEPVLSQGSEFVEILEDGWTAVTVDNSRSAQFEHTVLITETGLEILT